MHNSNVSCQISFSRSSVIAILTRIKNPSVLVVCMKPQGLSCFTGIFTFQTFKFSNILHRDCLNLAHCAFSYLKNHNCRFKKMKIDQALSLSQVLAQAICNDNTLYCTLQKRDGLLMLLNLMNILYHTFSRSSSLFVHNPSWAQLTCDRKYETVESAELPEIQLFVIDLLPDSVP